MRDYRLQSISKEIKKSVSFILNARIRDPRLKNIIITISHVDLSKDLSHAKIFLSFFLKKNNKLKKEIKIIKKASGFIRSSLSKNMNIRLIPKLTFLKDISLENQLKINKLLKK